MRQGVGRLTGLHPQGSSDSWGLAHAWRILLHGPGSQEVHLNHILPSPGMLLGQEAGVYPLSSLPPGGLAGGHAWASWIMGSQDLILSSRTPESQVW